MPSFPVNSQQPLNDHMVEMESLDKDHLALSEPTSHSMPVYRYPLDLGNLEAGNGHYISFQVMKAVGIKFTTSQENEADNQAAIDRGKKAAQQVHDAAVDFEKSKSNGWFDKDTLGAGWNLFKKQAARAYEATSTEVKKFNDTFKNYLKANKGNTTIRYPATEPLESVFLYIPGKVEVSYNAAYAGASLAFGSDLRKVLGGFMDSASLGDVSPESAAGVSEYARKIILNKTLTALDQPANFFGTPNLAKTMEAILREIPNPHMEKLFEGVDFRTFNFDFIFYPRNEDEARMIFNIIKTFKVNSMPALSLGGRFYQYPNEWRIKIFSSDGVENQYIPKFLPCACTSVKVMYGDDNAFTTFERIPDLNGSCPTKITLSLAFTELSQLDRNKILEGGY